MLQARYSPLISQAEITGKGQPDLLEFQRRRAAAGQNSSTRYGTLDDSSMLWIMPGELLVGRRDRKTASSFVGRPDETAFSSFNGAEYGGMSDEEYMRQFYFVGVAKTEYEYGGDNAFGMDPLDHGIGWLRAGSMTIINNSAEDIHAGDILQWRAPRREGKVDPGMEQPRRQGVDTGLNPIVGYSKNRSGTPYGKKLVEVEKFDPTYFGLQVEAILDLAGKSYARGGVLDVTDVQYDKSERKLTPLQEEAFGLSRGVLRIAGGEDSGFLTASGTITPEGVAELRRLLSHTAGAESVKTVRYLLGAIGSAWNAKTSRIIGKAMSTSKPTQSLDVMISHFKIGF